MPALLPSEIIKRIVDELYWDLDRYTEQEQLCIIQKVIYKLINIYDSEQQFETTTSPTIVSNSESKSCKQEPDDDIEFW